MVIARENKGFNIQVSNLEMSILKSCIENAREDFYSRIEVFLDNSPKSEEGEILEVLSDMRQKTFDIYQGE